MRTVILGVLTFNQIYSDGNAIDNYDVTNCWGCFLACFCSLFMIITVDGWYELVGMVSTNQINAKNVPLNIRCLIDIRPLKTLIV